MIDEEVAAGSWLVLTRSVQRESWASGADAVVDRDGSRKELIHNLTYFQEDQ